LESVIFRRYRVMDWRVLYLDDVGVRVVINLIIIYIIFPKLKL